MTPTPAERPSAPPEALREGEYIVAQIVAGDRYEVFQVPNYSQEARLRFWGTRAECDTICAFLNGAALLTSSRGAEGGTGTRNETAPLFEDGLDAAMREQGINLGWREKIRAVRNHSVASDEVRLARRALIRAVARALS